MDTGVLRYSGVCDCCKSLARAASSIVHRNGGHPSGSPILVTGVNALSLKSRKDHIFLHVTGTKRMIVMVNDRDRFLWVMRRAVSSSNARGPLVAQRTPRKANRKLDSARGDTVQRGQRDSFEDVLAR